MIKRLFTITRILGISFLVFYNLTISAQDVCSQSGNLMIYSNYDGGIVTIDVDADIPDLKIGICTYEPVRVTISGAFVSNVTEVIYAGFNSTQNNNNCGQGNFITSITGVPANKIKIQTYPEVGFENPNGWPNMVGVAGACDANTNAGGGNTPDQVVYFFQQETGGTLYAHFTQYQCWQNDVYQVSAGGNCCVLPVSGGPQVSFSASATEICQDACIDFTNTSSGGPFSALAWEFEGGEPAVSIEASPSVCYASPGTYSVKLTVNGLSGSNSLSRQGFITVSNPLIPGTFSFPEPVCPTDSSLNPIKDADFIDGGAWASSPGLLIDAETGAIRPAESEPGNYIVTYKPESSGCIDPDSASYTIRIEDLPLAAIKPSGEILLCAGESIVLNGPEGYGVYQWNEGSSGLSSISVSEPGIYYLSLQSLNGCLIGSDTAIVVESEEPIAAFDYQQTDGYAVQFNNTSSGAELYTWIFPDATVSEEKNPVFEFLYDDVWPLRLIAKGNCGSDTLDTTVVVIKTGLPQYPSGRLKISQVNNMLYLQLPRQKTNELQYECIDLTGRIIFSGKVSPADSSPIEIPAQVCAKGLFYLRVHTPKEQWSIPWFNKGF